jgi:hypothetical protein
MIRLALIAEMGGSTTSPPDEHRERLVKPSVGNLPLNYRIDWSLDRSLVHPVLQPPIALSRLEHQSTLPL